jgi:uncharacterized protein (DUF305 family)
MNTFARSGAAALAAALTVTLAACGGTSSTATGTSAAASTTSAAAGSTGAASAMMSSRMMSGQASAMLSQPAASADHNAADLAFTQQMIVHHQGAVEMADLAPGRAANQQVKDLATRIKAAQAPEIEQMTGWLTLWGAAMSTSTAASTTSDDSAGGMNHGGVAGMGSSGAMSTGATGMPGMMSDAQTQELTDATGAEFDRLFLQLMIVHHQGAIEMADTQIGQGSNAAAVALAESIKTSQTAEITEMQQLLQTL